MRSFNYCGQSLSFCSLVPDLWIAAHISDLFRLIYSNSGTASVEGCVQKLEKPTNKSFVGEIKNQEIINS